MHSDLVIIDGRPRVVSEPGLLHTRGAAQGSLVAWTGQWADDRPISVMDSEGHRWDGPTVVLGMHGAGIVAAPWGWQVTWVVDDTTYARVNLDLLLQPIGDIDIRPTQIEPGASREGFLDIRLDEEPLWVSTHRTTICSGVTFYLPLTRGPWTLGQDAQVERLLAYNRETATLYVAWNGKTQVASRLAVDEAGNPWIVPGATTLLVGRDDFEPYTSPPFVDEPPQAVPSFRVPDHEIRVQTFGGPGFRMNLGPGHDRDPHARPSGAFVTLDRDPEDAFQRQAAYAKQHGVPFFQYLDRPESRWTKDTLRRVPGVQCVAAVRCYPLGPGFLKIAVDDLHALKRAGIDTALVLAWYRQMVGYGPTMNWKLRDVLEFNAHTWDAACTIPTVKHALGFHQHREATHPESGVVCVDGLDSRPELALMAERIYAAAAAHVTLPPSMEPDRPAPPPDLPVEPEPPTGYIERGAVLMPGEQWASVDGQTWLHAQAEDGNLVLYCRDPGGRRTAQWSADIRSVDRCVFQHDGNLVAYGADDTVLWDSKTYHRGIVRARIESGRFVFLDATNQPVNQLPPIAPRESKTSWFGRIADAVGQIFRRTRRQ